MDKNQLFEALKKIQEPKGYFFNNDKALVMELLDGLIQNKERYGYMCCPCRLSMEDRELDKDIICPCKYREADVAEFGSCYCALYVTEEWNKGNVEKKYVPERRGE